MDHYVVSARKYRPSSFATVIGQKPLTAALKHAIATDRLAHAYLFCGSRGVGKTSCARIFAKTINCSNRTPEGEACNQCASCRAFNEASSLNIVELDAASHNGIDDIKELIEQVMVPPVQGRYRVFIIDEVHMLSSAAFNAFLKTLEEPPAHAIFILATTEKHKIIPTILSRCQIYDFSRITIADMVEHLQQVAAAEGIEAEPSALGVIAKKADGAMRDALSIFDQVAASAMGHITHQSAIDNLNILDDSYYGRLVEAFLAGDVPSALLIYKEVRDKGFDSQFFINGLAQYMRDLMVARLPGTIGLLDTDDASKAAIAAVAAKCQPKHLYTAMDLCNQADLNYRVATSKQLLVELTLVKLCQLCGPSPSNDGAGEGLTLKPITPAATAPAQPAPQARPAAPAAKPDVPSASAAPKHTAAAAPAQPAAQASAAPKAPTPATTAGAAPKRSAMSLSIKGLAKPAQPAEQAPAAKQENKGAYTEADVERLWKQYAEEHPSERILANTMLACTPKRLQGDSFALDVDGDIQVETFNESKADLLAFMRKGLGNDFFDITARATASEDSPITWTQSQVLEHMAKKHPALMDLIRDYGLSLR